MDQNEIDDKFVDLINKEFGGKKQRSFDEAFQSSVFEIYIVEKQNPTINHPGSMMDLMRALFNNNGFDFPDHMW